jgi:hypothetical protein
MGIRKKGYQGQVSVVQGQVRLSKRFKRFSSFFDFWFRQILNYLK